MATSMLFQLEQVYVTWSFFFFNRSVNRRFFPTSYGVMQRNQSWEVGLQGYQCVQKRPQHLHCLINEPRCIIHFPSIHIFPKNLPWLSFFCPCRHNFVQWLYSNIKHDDDLLQTSLCSTKWTELNYTHSASKIVDGCGWRKDVTKFCFMEQHRK